MLTPPIPLTPTLSPSDGEREKARRTPGHSLVQRQWGQGEGEPAARLHRCGLVHRDINPVAYSEPPRRNADLPSNAARICFRGRPAEPGQTFHQRSVNYKRARKRPNSYQSCGTTERPMVLPSQRDCVLQPRVAESARLPWVSVRAIFNPNGVGSPLHHRATTPVGLADTPRFSQGSSRLATLGFVTESLWDSALEFPKALPAG